MSSLPCEFQTSQFHNCMSQFLKIYMDRVIQRERVMFLYPYGQTHSIPLSASEEPSLQELLPRYGISY